MAKTYEGQTSEANIVKNEKETSKNTAQRIGGLLVDIVERVGGDVSELTASLENIVSGFDEAIYKLEVGERNQYQDDGNLPLDDVTVYSGGMINLASASVATTIRDRMAPVDVSGLFSKDGVLQMDVSALAKSVLDVGNAHVRLMPSAIDGEANIYYLIADAMKYFGGGDVVYLRATARIEAGDGRCTCLSVDEREVRV